MFPYSCTIIAILLSYNRIYGCLTRNVTSVRTWTPMKYGHLIFLFNSKIKPYHPSLMGLNSKSKYSISAEENAVLPSSDNLSPSCLPVAHHLAIAASRDVIEVVLNTCLGSSAKTTSVSSNLMDLRFVIGIYGATRVHKNHSERSSFKLLV